MSSLMVAMAIVKANWNENRDYVSNFEPFVADVLRTWPDGKHVKPDLLRDRLNECFSIPQIPIHTAEVLIDRAKRDELVTRVGVSRKFVPNEEKLSSLPDLTESRNDALRHIRALTDRLSNYAAEYHDLNWSEVESEDALNRFIERFSFEMAFAKRSGLQAPDEFEGELKTIIVHGFVRNAVERDAETLEFLEEMVKGSFLASQLYFHEPDAETEKFESLVVYLDTAPCLRLLGLAPAAYVDAMSELMALMSSFDIPVKIFDHTLTELFGVLESVENGLRRAGQAGVLAEDSPIYRETIEALINAGTSPADIQEIMSDLEARLLDKDVEVVDPPPMPSSPNFSERALEATLEEAVRYRNANARIRDVKSLMSVHILRGKRSYTKLSKTPAIFLTTNSTVARAGQRYFRKEGIASPIKHVMTDLSLTTQLWVRTPNANPDIAQTVLIAECYAGLNPSPALWNKYLKEIEAQQAKGTITADQVNSLIYSIDAQDALIEVTEGQETNVNADTPLEVLERYNRQVRRPIELQAQEARRVALEAIQGEANSDDEARLLRERLGAANLELDDQRIKIDSLTRWRDEREAIAAGRKRWTLTAFWVLAPILVLALSLNAIIRENDDGTNAVVEYAGITILAAVLSAVSVHHLWTSGGRERRALLFFGFAAFISLGVALIVNTSLGTAAAVFLGLVAVAQLYLDHLSGRRSAPESA